MPATQINSKPYWDFLGGFIIFVLVQFVGAGAILVISWYLATRYGHWKQGAWGCWHWTTWAMCDVWLYPEMTRQWLWWLRTSGTASLVLPIGPAIWAFFWAGKPGPAEEHVAGRQLSQDIRQVQKEMAEEHIVSGRGLAIHSQITISRDRETRPTFILGNVGAGKTVIIKPLAEAAIARGDRILIHDIKGDYTAQLPGKITLFAPWDCRSVAWDIGADVLDQQDAQTVAERLIPASSDPMWAEGSRQLLTAMICHCQGSYEHEWGFSELAELVAIPFEELQQIVRTQVPEACRTVEEWNRTSASFLIQLGAYMTVVCSLAKAWEGRPRFSFRRWLLDENSKEFCAKTLILQGNGRYKTLARGYVQAIISMIGSVVNSPEMEDDNNRRVWFLLDEFPQLGKLNDFGQLLEVGRSKGCCVVMGVQNTAQLRELYGADTVDSWSSIMGTYILARSAGVETPEWLSRLVGSREIRRYQASLSTAADYWGLGGGQRSEQWETVTVPVIRSEQFASLLGPTKKGVLALLLTGGDYVYKVLFPYPEKIKYRKSYVPAAWVVTGASQSELKSSAQRTEFGGEQFCQGANRPTSNKQVSIQAPNGAEYIPMDGMAFSGTKEQQDTEHEDTASWQNAVELGAEQMAEALMKTIGLGCIGSAISMLDMLATGIRTTRQSITPAKSAGDKATQHYSPFG